MQYLIGFLIALAVGLTGIGGGSFTVPALVLIVGLPAGASVGTAFVFAGVLRLIAGPFYLAGRHIHWRYLWLLSLGAVPGLAIGTYILRLLSTNASSPTVIILLGLLLTGSSSVTFIPRVQNQGFARKNSSWLPWLALLGCREEEAAPLAIEKAWEFRAESAFIEVEVRGENAARTSAKAFRRLQEAASERYPCLLMLDNMRPDQIETILEMLRGENLWDQTLIEASGGISEANLEAYADCGVDAISIGALTHSARAIDICQRIS